MRDFLGWILMYKFLDFLENRKWIRTMNVHRLLPPSTKREGVDMHWTEPLIRRQELCRRGMLAVIRTICSGRYSASSRSASGPLILIGTAHQKDQVDRLLAVCSIYTILVDDIEI